MLITSEKCTKQQATKYYNNIPNITVDLQSNTTPTKINNKQHLKSKYN